MTRKPSRLAQGGIARAISARARTASPEAAPADLAHRLRGAFEKLANAVGELAAQDGSLAAEHGEMPVEIGGKTGKMVFGYTVRMGLDGLRAEPFGDTPPPAPSTTQGARKTTAPAPRAPITDVFEEGGMLRIIAELPGATEQDIACTLDGQSLRIETRGTQRYAKTIALPHAVDPASLSRSCRNGILEVSLRRAAAP